MTRTSMLPIMGGFLILAAGASMMLGRFPVDWHCIPAIWGNPGPDPDAMAVHWNVLMHIRFPRVAAAILMGAALSVSGAAFQSMFINPLVSPGLLGVLAGASFGAAFGMVISGSNLVIQVSTFIFGMMAVGLSMLLARMRKGERLLMLILGGMISGAFFTALLSVVKYLADPYQQLPAIVYWLMGGLSAVTLPTVTAVCVPVSAGIIGITALSPYLNALSMGDEEARSLGVQVKRIRLILIFCATLVSALTVVVGGIVGWVGLVVPHVTRMLVGPDNRVLVPAAAITGAGYLLVMDDLSRMLFSAEVPLGILTALFGIPFFAVVLRRGRHEW